MQQTYRTILFHFIIIIVGYQVLLLFSVVSEVPNDISLLNWDGKWYQSIKDDGYRLIEYEPCNLAFFPLFPYIWKFSGFSPIQISITNYLVFLVSFYFLIRSLKVDYTHILLILSIPSFIFFGLVYSESVFFLFGTLILIGFKEKKIAIICIGLIGASMIRSVAVIFVPALLITEILVNDKIVTSKKLVELTLSLVSSLLGLFISAYIQFLQTGKWFYFLEIQKFWRRNWQIPKFPLTTVSPERILGIEAIAFTIGIVALLFLVKVFWLKIKKKLIFINEGLDKAVIFSALYLIGTTILDTTFTYNTGESTNIWSLNRHLLCTPFAVIFIVYITNHIKIDKLGVFVLIITIISCVFLTGVIEFGNLAFYYLAFFLFLFIFKFSPIHKNWAYAFYFINIFAQLVLYDDFLSFKWVG